MNDAGIFNGDVVVVDRAAEPSIGQMVLAEVDGEFVVRYLGRQQLNPASNAYPTIYFETANSIALIGLVTGSMRKFT
jgi:DNA polymerase V